MELSEIRKEIDKIDTEIISAISKRVALIPQVADYKIKNNLPRYNPQREREIIESKRKLAQELNVNPDLVEKVLKDLIEESHRIEKEIMGR